MYGKTVVFHYVNHSLGSGFHGNKPRRKEKKGRGFDLVGFLLTLEGDVSLDMKYDTLLFSKNL